jgi:hypothetical protein
MSTSTYVDKADVVTALRSRQLHERADWVDRALPESIDTLRNAALLRTLGLDMATMTLWDATVTRPGSDLPE